MTNPTRQEIINAHDAAEGLKNAALPTADFCGDKDKFLMWHKDILKALPPKPQPTMAEVEWDNDKHRFAEAEQNLYGNVIMLGVDDDNMNMIAFLVPPEFGTGIDAAFRETLTPTGKRYTLTEVQDD